MPDFLDDFIAGKLPKAEKPPSGSGISDSRVKAIHDGANALGIDPLDYATVISYESAGSFDPWKAGPTTKWGQHRGTIQYGEPQRKEYGVYKGQSFEDQVTTSNVKYLKKAGVKPGADLLTIYKAINGGDVNVSSNASDGTDAQGRKNTIGGHVQKMMGDHRKKAEQFLGGSYGSQQSAQNRAIDSFLGGTENDQSEDYGSAMIETPPEQQLQVGGGAPLKYPTPENLAALNLQYPVDPVPVVAPPQAVITTPELAAGDVIPSFEPDAALEQADIANLGKVPVGATNFTTGMAPVAPIAGVPQGAAPPVAPPAAVTSIPNVEGGQAVDPTPEQIAAAEATAPADDLSQWQTPTTPSGELIEAKTDADALTKGLAGTAPIDLAQKPQGENAGRWLLKQALRKLAPEYNLTDEEIEKSVNAKPQGVEYYDKIDDSNIGGVLQDLTNNRGGTQVQVHVTNQDINDILQARTGGAPTDINPELATGMAMKESLTAPGLARSQDNADIYRNEESASEELRKQILADELAKRNPRTMAGLWQHITTNSISKAYEVYERITGEKVPQDDINEINAATDARLQQRIGKNGSALEALKKQRNDESMPWMADGAKLLGQFGQGAVVDVVGSAFGAAGVVESAFRRNILGDKTVEADKSTLGGVAAVAMEKAFEKGWGENDGSILANFFRGTGQAFGQIALSAFGIGLLGKGASLMATSPRMAYAFNTALGVPQVVHEAYSTARAKGATEDQAQLTALLASPSALVEGITEARIFSKLKNIQRLDAASGGSFSKQVAAKFKQITKDAAQGGIEEYALEEIPQQLWGTTAARLVYEKDKVGFLQFLKDVDTSARDSVSALFVGAGMGGGASALKSMGEGFQSADSKAAKGVTAPVERTQRKQLTGYPDYVDGSIVEDAESPSAPTGQGKPTVGSSVEAQVKTTNGRNVTKTGTVTDIIEEKGLKPAVRVEFDDGSVQIVPERKVTTLDVQAEAQNVQANAENAQAPGPAPISTAPATNRGVQTDVQAEAQNVQAGAETDVAGTAPLNKKADELSPYASDLVASHDHVKSVSLIGSTATKGQGNDVDMLYDFGKLDLPKDEFEAAEALTEIIESTDGMDVSNYDTFIKADDRYFHISTGAGPGVIENTGYGKDNESRPRIVLAGESKVSLPKNAKDTFATNDTPLYARRAQGEPVQSAFEDELKPSLEKYKSVEEFTRAHEQSDLLDLSNRGQHRFGRIFTDTGSGIEDLPAIIKNYGTGRNNTLDSYKEANVPRVSSPDQMVTVYRSAPESAGAIQAGDYVSFSKDYADSHNRGKMYSAKVPAKDVIWHGNDFNEWVYSPAAIREKYTGLEDFYNKNKTEPGTEVKTETAREVETETDDAPLYARKAPKTEQATEQAPKTEAGSLAVFEAPVRPVVKGSALEVTAYIEANSGTTLTKPTNESTDEEIVNALVTAGRAELTYWKKNLSADYIGFYTDDIARTNKELQKWANAEIGRYLTNTEVKLFHLLGTLCASGASPEVDSQTATKLMYHYLQTGVLTGKNLDKIRTKWELRPDAKGKEVKVDTNELLFQPTGEPQRPNVLPKFQPEPLAAFNRVIETFDGTTDQKVEKAIEWLETNHSYKELLETTGAKARTEHEYLTKEKGGKGAFALFGSGAKLGSYYLNRVGDLSTITKDMWYARGIARYLGEPLAPKGKAIEAPIAPDTKEGLRQRLLHDQALGQLAKEFKMEPAEVQQTLWDFEQKLWMRAGWDSANPTFVSQGLNTGVELVETAKTAPKRTYATVGAAPNRVGTIDVLGNAAKQLEAKAYQDFKSEAIDIAKTFNLLNHGALETVGIYSNTSANMEESVLITVSGDEFMVDAYTAVMGSLAPDIQHTVMKVEYGGTDNNSIEHRLRFDSPESLVGFEEAKNKYGITDLSLEPASNSAIVLEFADTEIDLGGIQKDYEQQITNYEQRRARTDFVSEQSYLGTIQKSRDSVERHYSGARRKNILNVFARAEERLKQEKIGPPDDLPLKSAVSPETIARRTALEKERRAAMVSAQKEAFALPFIQEVKGERLQLNRPIDVDFVTESGRTLSKPMKAIDRQKQLQQKENVLNKLLDCINR